MSEQHRILVVGLDAGGAANLSAPLHERIQAADMLAGSKRSLQAFPHVRGRTLAITADIPALIAQVQQAQEAGERVVVLAAGDPLCYGIGATLRRTFPADALEVVPAPTAFQQAFATLAEPWHDAALLSVHARPLTDVVQAVLVARLAAVLTDREHTPAVLARELLEHGMPADTVCAVCENLGYDEQRIVRGTLVQIAEETFAPLNVFVVWGDEQRCLDGATGRRDGATGRQEDGAMGRCLDGATGRCLDGATGRCLDGAMGVGKEQRDDAAMGRRDDAAMGGREGAPHRRTVAPPHHHAVAPLLTDDLFSTEAGLITQREVRLLSLAELALAPGMVVWDIGAGSGAVSIEAARAHPDMEIYAIERREGMGQHIRENVRRHAVQNVHLITGSAPQICHDLPDPHAVFVGGSGGYLEAIITTAEQRLYPGGRLVINLVTLENLHIARACLPAAQVVQVQINQGVPIMEMLRFEARNPVFVVTWSKPCD